MFNFYNFIDIHRFYNQDNTDNIKLHYSYLIRVIFSYQFFINKLAFINLKFN